MWNVRYRQRHDLGALPGAREPAALDPRQVLANGVDLADRRAGQRAEIVTLAISDVPHDDPSAIASGPTVPDPTTLKDARAIVVKYGLKVDDAIRRALEDPGNESCKQGDEAFARAHFELIARPRASLDAAVKLARDAGYAIVDLGADLEGEAREVAAEHARLALKARAEGKRVAILSGGELTVTVRGTGRGGPNQEYALALAGLLKDITGISALAADTDGADGGAGSAADPAGAIICLLYTSPSPRDS